MLRFTVATFYFDKTWNGTDTIDSSAKNNGKKGTGDDLSAILVSIRL